jgi:hypothetical protein
VFRRPCSTSDCPQAQAAKRPVPAPLRKPPRGPVRAPAPREQAEVLATARLCGYIVGSETCLSARAICRKRPRPSRPQVRG